MTSPHKLSIEEMAYEELVELRAELMEEFRRVGRELDKKNKSEE